MTTQPKQGEAGFRLLGEQVRELTPRDKTYIEALIFEIRMQRPNVDIDYLRLLYGNCLDSNFWRIESLYCVDRLEHDPNLGKIRRFFNSDIREHAEEEIRCYIDPLGI